VSKKSIFSSSRFAQCFLTFDSRNVGNNNTNGLQIQPSFSEAQAMRNAAQAEAMHRGEFRPPVPYGHFEQPNFAPMPVDPKFAYMEQMNMMAHMSGFGSAEEMLFFQQSMMANMMGGGMNMNMPMPGMHMGGRGPNSSSAELYPQQQQQRCVLDQQYPTSEG
jgi:hypothetical protein